MDELSDRISRHLQELTAFPDRHVGGPGNRAATELFASRITECGFDVVRTEFDCLEWEFGEAALSAGTLRFDAHVGPYSHPCDLTAPLVAVGSVEDLESDSVRGAIVLLHGEIASGQVMPRNFTFYNPDSHKRVLRALDEFAPAAVVAATGRDPQMVGGQYPFPLFEDGDLGLPNAYMKDIDGEALRSHVGEPVSLRLESERIPATAEHIVASLPGALPGRIVLTAHIDSRKGSPGALDNASGVATLLAVAEMLSDWRGPTIEVVPFNGEDNYANPGEMLWVDQNSGRMEDIVLGVNIDDAGQKEKTTHVSFYGCPSEMEIVVRRAMDAFPRVGEGPQWFQSDHAIFGIYGRPAIAIAGSDIDGFMAEYAHTARDTIELADPDLIGETARFIREALAGVAAGLGADRD